MCVAKIQLWNLGDACLTLLWDSLNIQLKTNYTTKSIIDIHMYKTYMIIDSKELLYISKVMIQAFDNWCMIY